MNFHLGNRPTCEKCEVFRIMKNSSQRALACETARAIETCGKDKWYNLFLGELKVHYSEYQQMVKPPNDDETWYCLQYLELLIEEILGIADSTKNDSKENL